MKLDNHIPPKQLVTIIRSLLSFIIIDGKKLIDHEHRQEYVKRYLYTLSKAMNGVNPLINMNELIAQIEQDIAQYAKKEVLDSKDLPDPF